LKRPLEITSQPVREKPVPNYGAVRVTAPYLNVRSGPDRDYTVITVIQQGNIYPVQAVAEGWHYIQLTDGKFDWMEQIHTTPADLEPNG
jgi:SH3-like domain-containing protein